MLLAAAQSGQPRAFESLYRALSPAVCRYLWLNGANDPEGLANEVFLGVFVGLVSFSGREPQFRSWVFTIAHRRLIDDRRQSGRRPVPAGVDVGSLHALAGGDAEDDAMGSIALCRMREVLECLTADQRRVLLLRLVADLSVDQVAEATGKSVAAVKSLQRKGLEGLRRRLDIEKVAR
ncbi:MAG: sigma-70 family RNA polymerase sigma factor [Actinomycetota bacterium]|nr:sigma-70 family RNA polymerase sigma factor [Actinomycetota bacterium]